MGLLFHIRWSGSLTGDAAFDQRLKATTVFKAGGCVGRTAKRPAWLEHRVPGDVAGQARTRIRQRWGKILNFRSE